MIKVADLFMDVLLLTPDPKHPEEPRPLLRAAPSEGLFDVSFQEVVGAHFQSLRYTVKAAEALADERRCVLFVGGDEEAIEAFRKMAAASGA